jgi:hypothetical protein
MTVQRLNMRVAANPRRVSEIAINKMNASIPIFRFRYRPIFTGSSEIRVTR